MINVNVDVIKTIITIFYKMALLIAEEAGKLKKA